MDKYARRERRKIVREQEKKRIQEKERSRGRQNDKEIERMKAGQRMGRWRIELSGR